MKNFLLLFAFALTTTLSFSQVISDISQYGRSLSVRDEKNNEISSRILMSNEELCGFSSTIIVIKNGSLVIVYDQKFHEISSSIRPSNEKVKNISGNNIIIKNGSRVTTYDKKWNEISSRIE